MPGRKAPPGHVAFYKSVGGYDMLVKVRGRWYWVCGPMQSGSHLAFHSLATRCGVKLTRVGPPQALTRAQQRHGATWEAVIRELPQWTPEIGFGTDPQSFSPRR